MKRISIICVLLAALFIAVSCTDFEDGGRPDGLNVDKTALSFDWSYNIKTGQYITVQCGKKWKISKLPEWVTVSVDDGEYKNFKYKLYVNAIENDGYGRSGSFTISTESESVTISVSQDGFKGQYVALESVALDKSSLQLTEGDTYTLKVVFTPSNATNKKVTWSSSESSVASVTSSGIVTAGSEGTTTITVTTEDGNKSAECVITVESAFPSDGSENGYDWVDLDLPSGLKWATYNVGASKPEEYGDYFAWGMTQSKSPYNWSSYGLCNGSKSTLKKYNTDSGYGIVDNKTLLEAVDDVAHVERNGNWRIPTLFEIQELKDNCTWSWTSFNNIYGYKVVSKNNEKSIFIPAAGRLYEDRQNNTAGTAGFYWTSCLGTDLGYPESAHYLYLTSDEVEAGHTFTRYNGLSVRPVTDKDVRVSVKGVSIDQTTLTLCEDESQTLVATVSPDNATEKTVIWSSDNDAVVSVSFDGKVTAVAEGTATITATTYDGGFKAICSIIVKHTDLSITLDKSSLTFTAGAKCQLTASITPTSASVKAVTWTSSNEAVATVSNGMVKSKSEGTAIITASCEDKSAICMVTVNPLQYNGKENEHYWVDLGLPSGLKWATCNVGSTYPEDYGAYYAWGETSTKADFNWWNYKWRNSTDDKFTKYVINSTYGNVDNKTVLELQDDAAHVIWGGNWRMPTDNEFRELINSCSWEWITLGGHNGYKVTSQNNGNSIFIPASGESGSNVYPIETNGRYWSSSLCNWPSYMDDANALYFNSSLVHLSDDYRYCGFTIRPVINIEIISVSSVKINKDTLVLSEDESQTLSATVNPDNATDKSVVWRSEDSSIATVDQSGKVTAVSPGKTTITVTTNDGGLTAKCSVTVNKKVTGVTLNTTTLEIMEGQSETLIATVQPEDAANKGVSWKSGDSIIATVDNNGMVTGMSTGSVRITVTTDEGGYTASCVVTVNANPDIVDLGLSVRWATCNIGASSPEEYGDYYAWGEVETKTGYEWINYKFWISGQWTGNLKFNKYNTISSMGIVDNKTTLEIADDVARVKLGGNWRMPTASEFTELKNNCSWTWISLGGHSGYNVTSKKNGNSIFLPAAGAWGDDHIISLETEGAYWSSSLFTGSAEAAYKLNFTSSEISVYGNYRYFGRSIRPVIE